MQTRSLLEVLVELENLLPDAKKFIALFDEKIQKLLAGDSTVKIEDDSNANLNESVMALKNKFAETDIESLDKNTKARVQNAITLGEIHLAEVQQLLAKIYRSTNSLLQGIGFSPVTQTPLPRRQNNIYSIFRNQQREDDSTLETSGPKLKN